MGLQLRREPHVGPAGAVRRDRGRRERRAGDPTAVLFEIFFNYLFFLFILPPSAGRPLP